MADSKQNFRHESLQDAKSIQDILKSITKGIASGSIMLSDEDGEIVLEPKGLLSLMVKARHDDQRDRIDIRISWQTEEKEVEQKPLKVTVGK